MNQSHSCTVRQETIEAYIEVQQEVYRPTLHALHQCILTSMGEVEERMSWGMPTYYKEGNLLHFSVHVHHVTLGRAHTLLCSSRGVHDRKRFHPASLCQGPRP